MPWARLEDNYFTHHKVADLSKDAKLLDLAAIAFSSRELRDGELSHKDVRVIAAQVDVQDPLEITQQLIAHGRWGATETGFVIHDYLQYNPSREEVLKDREKTARRVAEWRASKKQGARNGVTNDEHTASPDPVPVPVNEPGPGPTEPAAPRAAAAAENLVDEFYETLGVEPNGLTRTIRKREVSIAVQLVEAGAAPGEARAFVEWCRAAPYRPVPSDLRVYENKRAQFLAGLEPVATSPPGRRNGSAPDHDAQAARADFARKFSDIGAKP